MNRLFTYMTLAACLLITREARALDSIRTTKSSITGTIEKISRTAISIRRSGGQVTEVPVNEIISVRFDGEPQRLQTARSLVQNGRYLEALQTIDQIEKEGKRLDRAEVQQDIGFYKAYATSRIALVNGKDIRSAGSKMRDFVERNPQSRHYFPATETLGDLLVALGHSKVALDYYEQLEQAPWVDFKMRAQVAKGRAHRATGKPDEAILMFESAIELASADDPLAEAARHSAVLGKAGCLAELKRYDEAVALVEEVIAGADPENAALHAQSYNTLGNCLRKQGSTKDALLAYLHVDVLYSSEPRAHAEALRNLAELWQEINQPQRADQARQVLAERYSPAP